MKTWSIRGPVALACAGCAIAAFVVAAHAASVREDTGVYISKDRKSGTLHPGAQVTVLQESGDWVKIRYETLDALFEGYVKKTAVQMAAGETTAPDTQPAQPAAPDTQPAPAIDPQPAPPDPAAQPAPTMSAELGLGAYWSVQNKSGGLVADDFATMLRGYGKPRVTTKATENYILYDDLYYLMPMSEALKKYTQSKTPPRDVTAPGFPNASFKMYTFDSQAEGFGKMTLVGDTKNQLVAVQLNDSGQKGLWLRDKWEHYRTKVPYSSDFRLYNVLEAGTKASSSWRVGCGMKATNGVLRIDSELLSGGQEWEAKSKERVRLYLPQPIIDLCLQLLSARR